MTISDVKNIIDTKCSLVILDKPLDGLHDVEDHLLLVVPPHDLNPERTAHGPTRGLPGHLVTAVVPDGVVQGEGVQLGLVLLIDLGHRQNAWKYRVRVTVRC